MATLHSSMRCASSASLSPSPRRRTPPERAASCASEREIDDVIERILMQMRHRRSAEPPAVPRYPPPPRGRKGGAAVAAKTTTTTEGGLATTASNDETTAEIDAVVARALRDMGLRSPAAPSAKDAATKSRLNGNDHATGHHHSAAVSRRRKAIAARRHRATDRERLAKLRVDVELANDAQINAVVGKALKDIRQRRRDGDGHEPRSGSWSGINMQKKKDSKWKHRLTVRKKKRKLTAAERKRLFEELREKRLRKYRRKYKAYRIARRRRLREMRRLKRVPLSPPPPPVTDDAFNAVVRRALREMADDGYNVRSWAAHLLRKEVGKPNAGGGDSAASTVPPPLDGGRKGGGGASNAANTVPPQRPQLLLPDGGRDGGAPRPEEGEDKGQLLLVATRFAKVASAEARKRLGRLTPIRRENCWSSALCKTEFKRIVTCLKASQFDGCLPVGSAIPGPLIAATLAVKEMTDLLDENPDSSNETLAQRVYGAKAITRLWYGANRFRQKRGPRWRDVSLDVNVIAQSFSPKYDEAAKDAERRQYVSMFLDDTTPPATILDKRNIAFLVLSSLLLRSSSPTPVVPVTTNSPPSPKRRRSSKGGIRRSKVKRVNDIEQLWLQLKGELLYLNVATATAAAIRFVNRRYLRQRALLNGPTISLAEYNRQVTALTHELQQRALTDVEMDSLVPRQGKDDNNVVGPVRGAESVLEIFVPVDRIKLPLTGQEETSVSGAPAGPGRHEGRGSTTAASDITTKSPPVYGCVAEVAASTPDVAERHDEMIVSNAAETAAVQQDDVRAEATVVLPRSVVGHVPLPALVPSAPTSSGVDPAPTSLRVDPSAPSASDLADHGMAAPPAAAVYGAAVVSTITSTGATRNVPAVPATPDLPEERAVAVTAEAAEEATTVAATAAEEATTVATVATQGAVVVNDKTSTPRRFSKQALLRLVGDFDGDDVDDHRIIVDVTAKAMRQERRLQRLALLEEAAAKQRQWDAKHSEDDISRRYQRAIAVVGHRYGGQVAEADHAAYTRQINVVYERLCAKDADEAKGKAGEEAENLPPVQEADREMLALEGTIKLAISPFAPVWQEQQQLPADASSRRAIRKAARHFYASQPLSSPDQMTRRGVMASNDGLMSTLDGWTPVVSTVGEAVKVPAASVDALLQPQLVRLAQLSVEWTEAMSAGMKETLHSDDSRQAKKNKKKQLTKYLAKKEKERELAALREKEIPYSDVVSYLKRVEAVRRLSTLPADTFDFSRSDNPSNLVSPSSTPPPSSSARGCIPLSSPTDQARPYRPLSPPTSASERDDQDEEANGKGRDGEQGEQRTVTIHGEAPSASARRRIGGRPRREKANSLLDLIPLPGGAALYEDDDDDDDDDCLAASRHPPFDFLSDEWASAEDRSTGEEGDGFWYSQPLQFVGHPPPSMQTTARSVDVEKQP